MLLHLQNRVARIRISQFGIFSIKKNNRTPRALLLGVGGVQKGPGGSLSRCERPLGTHAESSGAVNWDGPLPSSANVLASSEAWSLHFPSPLPQPSLQFIAEPIWWGVSSPYCSRVLFIASCVCRSVVDIRDTAMSVCCRLQRYSDGQIQLWILPLVPGFSLLSVLPEIASLSFFSVFLHGADECVGSTWGWLKEPLFPLASRSDFARQFGLLITWEF